MSDKEELQCQTSDQNSESSYTSRIRVCTADTALNHAVQERFYNYHFYYFQAGFLLPHRIIRERAEACYGGLNQEKTLFVLVPVELVQRRKRECLLQITHEYLDTDNQERLIAYCERAEQEMSTESSHHSHPAFQAEAQACQVNFWLGLLKQQQILPSSEWIW